MRGLILLLTLVAAVAAIPQGARIVGGSVTTINQYPEIASLLFSRGTSGHMQSCGGVIINNRSILTAAHCTIDDAAARWRTRTGSTFANSGGRVYNTNRIINHPQYNRRTLDNDVALIRTSSNLNLNGVARAGRIAGPNYFVADNQVVWAAGWGLTSNPPGGRPSEQLRHVQVWTVNLNVCRQRYNQIGMAITYNMLCSGWLDVGGRDQCFGDSGGPLYHNGNVVGICSFGPPNSCADGRFPGVNALVSRYASWISSNR